MLFEHKPLSLAIVVEFGEELCGCTVLLLKLAEVAPVLELEPGPHDSFSAEVFKFPTLRVRASVFLPK